MMNRRGFLQKLSATVATSYFFNIERANAQLAPLVAARKRMTIAHASGGRFYTSKDGLEYTSTVLPLINSVRCVWMDIAWNGSVYCAVGDGSACAVSTNLSSFTAGATPFSEGTSRIIANGSTFVILAAGQHALAATSTNGTTWTTKTMPATAFWKDIAWNGSVYCAVARGSASAATSPDATTWTLRSLPVSSEWDSIVWDGTAFVAVTVFDGKVATSPDGVTWTSQTSFTEGIIELQAVGSTIYALGSDTAQIYKSVDHGVSWANVGVPPPAAYSMAVMGTTYMTTQGNVCNYSTDDGATWSFAASGAIGGYKSVRAINGYFIAFGYQTTAAGLDYCTTPPTWTARTMPAVNVPGTSVSFAKSSNKYCLVPETGKSSLVSTDGINWTLGTMPVDSQWNSVAWGAGVFCAVPLKTSNTAATSPDGITWTSRTLPASKAWVSVVWNGTLFCAMSGFGSSNIAATSPDGITWTSRTLPVSGTWKQMIWNGSVFCVIQSGSNIALTSPDGITWTQRTLPSSTTWSSLVWTGTCFVALSLAAGCAVSTTGATWTMQSTTVRGENMIWNGVNLIAYQDVQYALVSHDLGATWTSYAGNWLNYPGFTNAGVRLGTVL